MGVQSYDKSRSEIEESLEELRQLASTAEADVVDVFIQKLGKPNAKSFVGKGMLEKLLNYVKEHHITTVIVNDNLSPSQARSFAQEAKCNVVDRTELILDIFSRHARTKQSKLQVELAQLEYNYSRLRRMWVHLSRIEGGIGFRGPGEKQIELDRREIKKKIAILRERLAVIEKETKVKRNRRKDFLNIAIVGYTNAGKSTLFNRLTRGQVYTADQLFATLDATTRSMYIGSGLKATLTDTIGFIDHLPHHIVSSFHSTLMEVVEADLLLHVVDASNPRLFEQMDSVHKVLSDLKVQEKDILMVFNKWDKVVGTQGVFLRKKLATDYPSAVFMSAIADDTMTPLLGKFEFFLAHRKTTIDFLIPEGMEKLLTFLYGNGEVIGNEYDSENHGYRVTVRIGRELVGTVERQIEGYKYRTLLVKNDREGGKQG